MIRASLQFFSPSVFPEPRSPGFLVVWLFAFLEQFVCSPFAKKPAYFISAESSFRFFLHRLTARLLPRFLRASVPFELSIYPSSCRPFFRFSSVKPNHVRASSPFTVVNVVQFRAPGLAHPDRRSALPSSALFHYTHSDEKVGTSWALVDHPPNYDQHFPCASTLPPGASPHQALSSHRQFQPFQKRPLFLLGRCFGFPTAKIAYLAARRLTGGTSTSKSTPGFRVQRRIASFANS